MNETICPVIFQNPSPAKKRKALDLDAVLSGQKLPPKETPPKTFECKIVSQANEIIIKDILPDERDKERFKYMNAHGLTPAPRPENDRFGINILIDEGAIPAHQKITAITILESWREPSAILKRTLHSTSACAWLERMSGTPVSIELADGTVLHGNIEPRLKEARKQIEQLESDNRVRQAEETASLTLKEAVSRWFNFDPPGMKAITKAKISRAVQLYLANQKMRSETKIAGEFGVSRKQVSIWFKTFTEATGFKVVTHKRHESVRDHIHGPEHRTGRKTTFEGEDKGTAGQDTEPTKDPFFAER